MRRAFEAWNAGDLERMLEMVHDELEFLPLRSQLDGAAYIGREGVRQFASDAAEEWEYLRIVRTSSDRWGTTCSCSVATTRRGAGAVSTSSSRAAGWPVRGMGRWPT